MVEKLATEKHGQIPRDNRNLTKNFTSVVYLYYEAYQGNVLVKFSGANSLLKAISQTFAQNDVRMLHQTSQGE